MINTTATIATNVDSTVNVTETMLVDVLLLCTECQQPIKARINTTQWIRVEWIGPSGECQACYNEKKADDTGSRP